MWWVSTKLTFFVKPLLTLRSSNKVILKRTLNQRLKSYTTKSQKLCSKSNARLLIQSIRNSMMKLKTLELPLSTISSQYHNPISCKAYMMVMVKCKMADKKMKTRVKYNWTMIKKEKMEMKKLLSNKIMVKDLISKQKLRTKCLTLRKNELYNNLKAVLII